MFPLIRQHWRYFLFFALLGITLRLFLIFQYPVVAGDGLVYGDIAKNLLNHHAFGFSTETGVSPTWIRLPGYPFFLAIMFKIAGMEHYRAALLVQLAVDVVSCMLIAGLTWETLGRVQRPQRDRAALIAFALAALCPFTANYTAAALTETWTIFLTALAFYAFARALHEEASEFRWWVICGLAIGLGLMFRPDHGTVLIAIGGWVLWRFLRGPLRWQEFKRGVVLGALVLVFLVPWTIRNWRTMHGFQPLAPYHAADPGEYVPAGFDRWAKSWLLDFISVERISWHVDGEPIDPGQLPGRAWDVDPVGTRSALDAYNDSLALTPAIDAQFEQLARERIAAHPIQYYALFPALRVADMWLRPRTELLPIETDWWNYENHEGESQIAVALGALNLLFLLAAVIGAVRSRGMTTPGVLVVGLSFVFLRTLLLGTLETPEPRYTLEMFPIVLILAAMAFTRLRSGESPAGHVRGS